MSELNVYRKKPVEIVATQWDGTEEHAQRIMEWLGSSDTPAIATYTPPARTAEEVDGELQIVTTGPFLSIHTLEGVMKGGTGWFIIQGIQGEFYPCEPSIFEGSYEMVEPAIPDPADPEVDPLAE